MIERRKTHGVFVGLTCLDIVYYQDAMPAENQKSKTSHYDVYVGGPAANHAITYSLLGGRGTLVTSVGDTGLGRMLKNELIAPGRLDLIDCSRGLEILPSVSSINISPANGARTVWSGQQAVKPAFEGSLMNSATRADFCLCDCNLPGLSLGFLQEIKRQSKPVILDAGSWKEGMEGLLSLADEVIASEDCIPPYDDGNFFAAAARCGVKHMAVTHGENPIQWVSGRETGMIEPPRVKAVDTLGAGDVFHGAYCYFRYEHSLTFVEALARASEIAAESVKHIGPREGIRRI